MAKEEEIPKFPSLATCLLIDASHKSRAEITKDIKASSLFEEIIEAKSLEDALERIQIRSFDACLVGPSVSLDLVNPFIRKAKPRSYAKDCALVAIIKRDNDPSSLTDAHAIVKIPCTRQAFFEAVVRGVLLAGAGQGWPGVKLSDDGSVMFLEGSEWKILKGDPDRVDLSKNIIPENFVLSGDSECIRKFCDGLQTSPPSRIEKIIKTLLSGSAQSNDPFVRFFIEAIKEWKDDQSFLSLKEASQNLRQRLLSFKED